MPKSSILDDETIELLELWGRWGRQTGFGGLGYASKTNFAPPSSRTGFSLIDESKVNRVEQAVKAIHSKSQLGAKSLRYKWVLEFSGRKIAKELRTNKDYVYKEIDIAETLLTGFLLGLN